VPGDEHDERGQAAAGEDAAAPDATDDAVAGSDRSAAPSATSEAGDTDAGTDEDDSGSAADRLRVAILATEPATLNAALRRMPKHLSEGIAKQVGVPAPVLRRDPSPARFLRRTETPAIFATVADAVCDACFDATIELLGEAADDPTLNQLRAAVDGVAEEFPPETIALMLVATAASGAPATEACEQILRDDPRFELPDEVPDDLAPAGDGAPAATAASRSSGPSPEELAAREERKARKAERKAKERERQRKAQEAAQAGRKQRRKKSAPEADRGEPSGTADDTTPPVASGGPTRRPAGLVPAEAAEFDAAHPWVGQVVIAEIPFEGDDPDDPGTTAKRRPAVVIGVSDTHLLVRPGYSEGGAKARTWKSVPLRHWHQTGLHEPTWVELEPRRIPRIDASDPIGPLSTEDWNSLW
jgi:chemotaxis protein histidine kinase CheA